jgi:uncharacterized repeat protein (TIGR01451 family)
MSGNDRHPPTRRHPALLREGFRAGAAVLLGVATVVAVPMPAHAAAPVTVAVSDGRAVAARGDLLRYSVTISNPTGTARRLSVDQTLGAELTFVSASDGGRYEPASGVGRGSAGGPAGGGGRGPPATSPCSPGFARMLRSRSPRPPRSR